MRGAERTTVEQVHLRHILLKPSPLLDAAAAKQKIIGIRQQILGGGDFGTLAHAVSEDPGSANDGGDLGWVSPGELVPEFEKAVNALPPHELSEPIQSRYGWHIAEVLERREHDTTDEVKREECTRSIRQSKAEEERELWLRKLRDQAYVDIRH
jgi:peptidyl-prolyl cis-trans isomerase SurA